MKRTVYGNRTPSLRQWNSTTLTPAAAANTNGTSQNATASTGYKGLSLIHQVAVTFGGTFNSETATCLVTINFSDGTSASAFGLTGTTAGTSGVSSNDIAYLMRDNTLITSITVALQSTRASSAVTATVRVTGTQV